MNTSNIVGLLIAALGGAAVGLERQWSGHAEGPGARFAGIPQLLTAAQYEHANLESGPRGSSAKACGCRSSALPLAWFCAFGVGFVLSRVLYGVVPIDVPVFAAVTALLLTVSLACYLPARRATRIDPLVALRYE